MPPTPPHPTPAAADEPARIRQLLELNHPELAEAPARQRLAAYSRELATQLAPALLQARRWQD